MKTPISAVYFKFLTCCLPRFLLVRAHLYTPFAWSSFLTELPGGMVKDLSREQWREAWTQTPILGLSAFFFNHTKSVK